jgi:hypothetical protein
VRCTMLVCMGCGELFCLIRWQREGSVGPSGFSVWKSSEDCIPRVMGYVLLSSQWKGHGVAVYDSFDLEAVA